MIILIYHFSRGVNMDKKKKISKKTILLSLGFLVAFAALIIIIAMVPGGQNDSEQSDAASIPTSTASLPSLPPAAPSSQAPPSSAVPSSSAAPPPVSSEPAKININTATEKELLQIPGILKMKARLILLYREEYGPFQTVEDLMHVDGIGPEFLELIRPYVYV